MRHTSIPPTSCYTGALRRVTAQFGRHNLHQSIARRRAITPFWVLSVALASLAVGSPAVATAQAALELNYHLRLSRPATHILEIEIDAAHVASPAIDFVLPAWSPGRYAIYDFAKNVQEFQAEGAAGQSLDWMQPDKQTWRVDARNSGGTVRVHYRVYADDLNGSFSQFDTTHANLNGASIYMYVDGHKQDPLALSVDALPDLKPAWKIISGFSISTDQKSFSVPSYDRLIDTPLEICGECSLGEFRERDKSFRVAIHDFTSEPSEGSEAHSAARAALAAKFADELRRVVQSEMAMMPLPDFETYTFIFHFAPDISAGDGMEHLNSTQIIMTGALSDSSIRDAVETAAHEFFHVWNVKRLRPAALGPFDYTRENYTPSLWFAEGITSYYAYVHLLRSGIWSRQDFLKHMADEIRSLELTPGRALMSAESSSFHAWFYDRAPQLQETNFANATISYYNKGEVLGMLLDLEIRSRTRGQKSLDDVLRSLYHNFYEASAATSYGPGRGYEERDILDAVNTVAGSDFTGFFDKYVRGTEPLPYGETLALAGLELKVGAAVDASPTIGVSTQLEDRGLRVTSVWPGSAAERSGLSRDDLLINVDELSLATGALKDRLKMYPPGSQVPFTIERHLKQERVTVTLDPPFKDQYSIEEMGLASADQKNIRNGWLGGAK